MSQHPRFLCLRPTLILYSFRVSPKLAERVPEGHLAHHVSDLVDALDLGAFYAPYKGDGRRNSPYDPRMMVKVLIYAYGTGTFLTCPQEWYHILC